MEDTQIKKTKMADEKYCSECGKIILLKAEICPKCGVRQLPILDAIENSTLKNKKIGEKFLYSAGTTFLVFLIIILTNTPQHEWILGFIGSCVLAFLSGTIAIVIPTIRKIIYLPVCLSIMLVFAILIGLTMNK